MKLSKNEKLNTLFTKLENKTPEYENVFVSDGIIDESMWELTSPKILFIAKEPNHGGEPVKADFRNEWNEEKRWYHFKYRIAEWAHGILNDFPPFDDIFEKKDFEEIYKKALKSIAFMNVKKSGGNSIANHFEISTLLNKTKDELIQQIQIINPEIIICSLVDLNLVQQLFNVQNEDWVHSGYSRKIFKWNNIKVVDFYHPSARVAPAASYSLLQNIVMSQNFKNI